MTHSSEIAKEAIPRLIFAGNSWEKMMMYVQKCPVEINGYGLVDRSQPGILRVTDVVILDQVASAASVTSEASALARYGLELFDAGGNPEMIRLQWHSHVHMAAYFSGTDLGNIDGYDREGCQWMVSVVVNKRGEHQARLDIYDPFRMHAELVCEVEIPHNDELEQACAADIDRHVRVQGMMRKRRVDTEPLNDLEPVTISVTDIVV